MRCTEDAPVSNYLPNETGGACARPSRRQRPGRLLLSRRTGSRHFRLCCTSEPTKGDSMDSRPTIDEHSKDQQLAAFQEDPDGQYLTSDQGLRIADTDNSLRAGGRGPTLMEDFH